MQPQSLLLPCILTLLVLLLLLLLLLLNITTTTIQKMRHEVEAFKKWHLMRWRQRR